MRCRIPERLRLVQQIPRLHPPAPGRRGKAGRLVHHPDLLLQILARTHEAAAGLFEEADLGSGGLDPLADPRPLVA